MIMRTSSSHEEGVQREFAVQTVKLTGDKQGRVTTLHAVKVEQVLDQHGRRALKTIEGSEHTYDADLVLLAMGFVGPEKSPLLRDLGLELTERGNVKVDAQYMTSKPGVFAAGDMQRGQSLVVWALWEGRECARGVDAFLTGQTDLPAAPNVSPLALP
jgi:glutamate synthase (NADPH/NADH) small chain